MMKKRSKLALVLAFLLSATTVLSGCGDSLFDSESSSSSDFDSKTPEQLEQEANISYSEKIEEWTRYITCDERETTPKYGLSELTSIDTNKVKTNISVQNGVYVKTKTESVWEYVTLVEGEEPVERVTEQNITQAVYDLETRTRITPEFKGKTVQFNGAIIDKDNVKSDQIEYEINTAFKDEIIEVKKTAYVLQEDAEDEDIISNYDAVVTYNYYDKNGTALASALEDRGVVDSLDSRFVTIGEYTYLVEEGEIILKVNKGEEHEIPDYANGTGYAYVKEGDYGYCVREEEMIFMPMGELTAYMLPGMEIQITNKQYDIVAEYKTDCYAVKGYAILPDGNVYICELDLLDSNATEYDFMAQDMKFNVVHTIIDVTTGDVSVTEKNYMVGTIYSNTTSELASGINGATMSNVYGEIKMKDGYMLAEIQNFSEGVLSPASIKVVLDENLNVVAELPNIIPNQFGYAGFIDQDRMLLATKSVGTQADKNVIIFYSADVETGDLNLFPHNYQEYAAIDWFIPFEGGYYYAGKVYGEEWELLSDLEMYTLQAVVGSKLLLRHKEYSTYCYGKIITDYNYNYDYELNDYVESESRHFEIEELDFSGYEVNPSADYSYYKYDGGVDGYFLLYNATGECLQSWTRSQSYSEYVDGYQLQYTMTRNITISSFGEDAYLVKVTESWTLVNNGEVISPSNNKHNKNYTRYYIMN